MSILTDASIREALDRHIVIHPFSDDSLTPVGYDLAVGDFAYALGQGVLEPNDNHYVIRPYTTVLVMSREAIWVSQSMAGTFHSKVSLVSRGLSPISTTLDPGWRGPVLIAITNFRNKSFLLEKGRKFVTLLFHTVASPAIKPVEHIPTRPEIIAAVAKDDAKSFSLPIDDIAAARLVQHELHDKIEKAMIAIRQEELRAEARRLEKDRELALAEQFRALEVNKLREENSRNRAAAAGRYLWAAVIVFLTPFGAWLFGWWNTGKVPEVPVIVLSGVYALVLALLTGFAFNWALYRESLLDDQKRVESSFAVEVLKVLLGRARWRPTSAVGRATEQIRTKKE